MPNVDHLIVGGGLAGTTIATHLHARHREFILLERSPRLGGKIETKWTQAGCFEFGPNSFSNKSDEIFALLRLLNLESDLLAPDPASRNRYILRGGHSVRLPRGPQDILWNSALSLKGRLRLLQEIFNVPPKKTEEESVWQFMARHFGREVADWFADPFVSGIFAGDVHRLSVAEAFPTMVRAEQDSGSMIRHLIRQRKTAKASPQSFQLRRGLESIFVRARELIPPEQLLLGTEISEMKIEGTRVRISTKEASTLAKKVILSIPAYAAALLVKDCLPATAEALKQISYAPVISAHLRVSKKEHCPFNGFGLLIPSLEKRRILGVLWNSSTFPELFLDKENHYLTVYAGGTRHPEQIDLPSDQLISLIQGEVQDLFQLKTDPEVLHMRRHPQAIPQYLMGYGKIRHALQDSLSSTPQIQLAGNYLGGVSMPDTVASAVQSIAT